MRKVEVFTANCPVCQDTVALVLDLACPSCEVVGLDVNNDAAATRAAQLDVRSIPAVSINGELADCCTGRGVDPDALRAAGVGQPE